MSITVKLEAFEGPFDLLFHLIEKNKINIYDIPIALITDQFMEYVDAMQERNMDNMSEFLVMAATLLEIKSKMLLPIPKKEEEEEAKKRKKNLGPFLTVATAFFIGELGDKTQLTTITLAADSQFPLIVLMGTVSAMMLTSGLGICVGCKIGNKIPKPAIKITAAAIFLILGCFKLYTHLFPA